MTERRTHTFASNDYLRRLDVLTEDLERHISENASRHIDYENWINEIKGDVHAIRKTLNDIQQHTPMLSELSRERQERAKLLYSVKEKVLGSTILAVLLFIAGAVGAALISWAKTKW